VSPQHRIIPPIVSRFARLPIRWRLAVTSAVLTFLILAAFALVVGAFAGRQVRDHFDDDLRATVGDLQGRTRFHLTGDGRLQLAVPADTIAAAAAGDARLRIVQANGVVTLGRADLGPPTSGPHDVGQYRVVSRPLFVTGIDPPVAYVQYAKPKNSYQGTIDRIRVFLIAGVFGGALLALLAGLAVARRAMGPVQQLTSAAKEIARTRDAAVTLPRPLADDEVADLSRTLSEMLRELNAARAELESLLARQREFVADASHELRTPLTSIYGFAETLLREDIPFGDEERRTFLSYIASESERLTEIVDQLLNVARLDAGDLQVELGRIDVGSVVSEVVETVDAGNGHRFEIDLPDEPLAAEADPDKVRQVFSILVENALRYSPEGGTVIVGARRNADRVEVRVVDEGMGIPASEREWIFRKFYRAESAARDGAAGTGLGLFIAKELVNAMGGRIWVDSTEGEGSSFAFELPVARD
jgi:signal transduction histidine kinase